MLPVVTAAAAGALFGLGLVVSQMSNPEKVLAFLDLRGNWDPSLALVMAGAVFVSFAGYRVMRRMQKPVLGLGFQVPGTRTVDSRLLAGAALFGLGWGLSGYCPGPAITAISINPPGAAVFLLAMAAGSWLQARQERLRGPG